MYTITWDWRWKHFVVTWWLRTKWTLFSFFLAFLGATGLSLRRKPYSDEGMQEEASRFFISIILQVILAVKDYLLHFIKR